jgi:hypothetical protein
MGKVEVTDDYFHVGYERLFGGSERMSIGNHRFIREEGGRLLGP